MSDDVSRYSIIGTVWLCVLLFVTFPFAMLLAIFFFPPWCLLAFYVGKRVWKGHGTL